MLGSSSLAPLADFLFDAFSSREPVSTSLENALSNRLMRSMGRRGSHRLRIRRRFTEQALITLPFHDPAADRAMTIANELGIEARRAPGAPKRRRHCSGSRWRMRRAQHPSRLGGRGQRLGRHPQHQSGDAGGLRSERELAARHEIELFRLAPELEHHGPQRVAGERVGRGAKRGLGIGGTHRHHAARIETELGETTHRQRPRLDLREILPHPQ